MIQADIVAIGSELTSGRTINANAAYLARRLEALGIRCRRHQALPDDPATIHAALAEALRHSRLVIVTGGLGPTVDDVTVEAIARTLNRPLVVEPRIIAHIKRFYRAYRRRLDPLALRQAKIPAGAVALPNPAGTAPGLWMAVDAATLVVLPGVPREMQAIMEQSVLPRLQRWKDRGAVATRTLRTVGLVELEIQRLLCRLAVPSEIEVGLYPHLLSVDIRLTLAGGSAASVRRLDRLARAIRRGLGDAVYGVEEQTLEAALGALLTRRRATVAVAESCTGGLVSDRLTNVSGSSRYLRLSIVAYHNDAKRRLLGVSEALLARYGAVSAPAARAMAQGVRRLGNAQVGLAITGIAGPTGGTRRKPVGLVYLALADGRRTVVRRCHFRGERVAVKYQASQLALDLLRRWVLGRV